MKILQPLLPGLLLPLGLILVTPTLSNPAFQVIYPPNGHETTADRIFLIGTAPPQAEVTINGQVVQQRSSAGHFAPSFPLQVGENTFVVRAQNQDIRLQIKRLNPLMEPPQGLAFAPDSLTPKLNLARLPNEPICFSAIANPAAEVTVKLGNLTLPLRSTTQANQLPDNKAALTGTNQPIAAANPGLFQGCTALATPGSWGPPLFQLNLQGKSLTQTAPGSIEILDPVQFTTVEVISAQGVARTGPSSDYSRLTPLPKGTQATVSGREGDWLRLDYGGWIRGSETRALNINQPVRSLIRSIRSREVPGWTEILFPLQVPVPIAVDQGRQSFTLTLYNTTAQTDTIFLNQNPVIERLDWQQLAPGQVQYRFNLKSAQQWGYKLRYEGSSLVLALRHPPQLARKGLPLQGIKILLDPGHGGPEDLGARGPTGYPEKAVTLIVSQLLQQELTQRGATVILTRTADVDLDLPPRVDLINREETTIALSLHYNALPDNGDALRTQGVGMFWYQAQSQDLAVFLHDYLVNKLQRPSYGVYWNNLALTRPTVAPAVLLELGFMINPSEFEWITDPQSQRRLATTLAEGITAWLRQERP